jgi:hypothetical protein
VISMAIVGEEHIKEYKFLLKMKEKDKLIMEP